MLTDEQIDTVTDAQWGFQAVGGMYLAYRAYARAIEAETLKARPQDTRVFDAHIAKPETNPYLKDEQKWDVVG